MKQNFIEEYLSADSKIKELYQTEFQSVQQRKQAIEEASARRTSTAVCDVLEELNNTRNTPELVLQNLKAMREGEAACVLCGQQSGLFGGPLFVFYKVISAIKLAKTLSSESGRRVVPIFWVQSEDHNRHEIETINLPEDSLKLSEKKKQERISAKYKELGSGIEDTLHSFESAVKHFAHAEKILKSIKQHYTPVASFSNAFLGLMRDIFAEHGLLIFDVQSPGLSDILSTVYFKALKANQQITQALLKRSKHLKKLGFEEQVPVIENSPLFFFHQENERGPRYRLEQAAEGKWRLRNSKQEVISEEDLLSIIELAPKRISSSALLRPVIQDTLFPTAALVAGNAEIKYLAQTNVLYQIFDLKAPMIVPRAHFQLLEPKTKAWLKDLQLSTQDLLQSEEEQSQKLAQQSSLKPTEELLRETKEHFTAAFSGLRKAAKQTDKTLLASIDKFATKTLGQLEGFATRYTKAVAERDSVRYQRLQRLHHMLFPMKKEQERYFSFAYYLAKYGPEFERVVMEEVEPLSGSMKTIQLS